MRKSATGRRKMVDRHLKSRLCTLFMLLHARHAATSGPVKFGPPPAPQVRGSRVEAPWREEKGGGVIYVCMYVCMYV